MVIDEFVKKCREMGIRKGDILYVSSDMTRLTRYGLAGTKKKNIEGNSGKKALDVFMDDFVEALKALVGQEGTLLIPVFTWDFCRGKKYDINSTPGEVGALGNYILKKRKEFKRTIHPIYSFMVWGRDKELLTSMKNKTGWGEDSPFQYLSQGGKNLLINVELEQCFTMLHYTEEKIGVPYRYFKDFRGSFRDYNGEETERVFTMYVRDLDIESEQVTPEDALIEKGAAHRTGFEAGDLQLVDIGKAVSCIKENLLYHNGNEWYKFKDYIIDWNGPQTHENEVDSV